MKQGWFEVELSSLSIVSSIEIRQRLDTNSSNAEGWAKARVPTAIKLLDVNNHAIQINNPTSWPTDLQTFTIISLEKSKHFITIFLDVNEMVTKEVGNISIFCSFKLAFQNSSASKGIPSTQLQHNHLHCCLALHKGMGPVVQNLRENMFNNLRNHCNTLLP